MRGFKPCERLSRFFTPVKGVFHDRIEGGKIAGKSEKETSFVWGGLRDLHIPIIRTTLSVQADRLVETVRRLSGIGKVKGKSDIPAVMAQADVDVGPSPFHENTGGTVTV